LKKLPARKCVQVGAAVVLFSGCFSYVPAEPGTLPEGGRVRVQLTRQGFAALPEIPNQSGPRLAGTLVRRNDDQLRLRVPIKVDGPGPDFGQEVVIPAGAIVGFERRELSRSRTAIAIAGGLATAAALYIGFEKGRPFTRDESEQPQEEEPGIRAGLRRVLLLRIPIS
jgi:hypothetical protein